MCVLLGFFWVRAGIGTSPNWVGDIFKFKLLFGVNSDKTRVRVRINTSPVFGIVKVKVVELGNALYLSEVLIKHQCV